MAFLQRLSMSRPSKGTQQLTRKAVGRAQKIVRVNGYLTWCLWCGAATVVLSCREQERRAPDEAVVPGADPEAASVTRVPTDTANVTDRWQRAERDIRRLKPAAFAASVPTTIVADLERRGCTVPQLWFDHELHNAVRGEFRTLGQVDWAILCSIDGASSILIFWNGRVDDVAVTGTAEDKHYLQGVGGGQIGFSRVISVASIERLNGTSLESEEGSLPLIEHQGIEDSFAEKGSTIHYYFNGAWWRLRASD